MTINADEPGNRRVSGLVSIITPAFNSRKHIRSTIQSIIDQTYPDWELLIVDDCSTDGTLDYIRASFGDLGGKMRLFSLTTNSGPAVARNKAIGNSRGQYIAFLDSDDFWLPNKLEAQLEFMRKINSCFSFTSYNKIDENGKIVAIVEIAENKRRVSYKDLLYENVVQCSSVIYDSVTLGVVCMPLIRQRQDFGLWLKLLKKTTVGHSLNMVLGSYRVREDSLSSNKFKSIQYTWKIYREFENLHLPSAVWYFSNYLLRTIRKNYKANRKILRNPT